MRSIRLVDERDMMFKRHDTRYRLFLYEGPENAVSVYEISECSVEGALEAAEMMSRGDELLWSLAVVVESPGPGLIWVSGNDYNAGSQRDIKELQHRWRMQNRYLRAKLRRGEQPLLPNGLRCIRMFPEWSVDLPLWESFSEHYPCEPGELPIPTDLEQALMDWNREWQSHAESGSLPISWAENGWGLHRRLQTVLNGFAEVRPEFARP